MKLSYNVEKSERKEPLKGIALAIDTTIIIILAVLVLAVLLFMLLSTSGPFSKNVQAELARTQNCNAYRSFDADCSLSSSEYNTFKSQNEKLLEDLGEACTELKISGCSKPASGQCIRACCIGCQKTTTTTKATTTT